MNMHKSLLVAFLAGMAWLGSTPASAQVPGASTATRPAYYVAEFQATDPEGIKPYSAQVEATFAPYSGRYVVRGGDMDVREGMGAQGRLVMIQFDSLTQARAWYDSPEYRQLRPMRFRAGNTRAYIVEGLAR